MRAVRELERLVKEDNIRGMSVAALNDMVPASDRRYYPLYTKCVELGIPVRIYTAMTYASDRPYELGHPRHLDQVAMDFPELTIIAGLAGWPWVNEMVGLLRRHGNLFCDTAAHRPRHFATPGSGWEQFLQFGNTLLQDKVMVGLSWTYARHVDGGGHPGVPGSSAERQREREVAVRKRCADPPGGLSGAAVTSMSERSAPAAELSEAVGAILQPRSVAVIGASAERHTLGNQVLENLRRFGFEGEVTCVHPRASSIEGWPAVPSVADLPDDLDVAMVSVPAGRVTSVLTELDAQGCRSAVVPAAGFAGPELAELEEASSRLRIRFNGPNCLGALSVAARAPLWTPSFRMDYPAGNVAIVSQSGSAAISITTSPGLGWSRVVSSGNETSITTADYLNWLAGDDATEAVGLVIEGIKDARAFAASIERMHEAGKPVVALKVGRTPQGSRAAQAHTGVLISNYDGYQAFFRRIGVPAVLDYDDMVCSLQALATRPARSCRGTTVGVLAISGGQSALACDLAIENGLDLADFTEGTASRLRAALPDITGQNPVDIGATVGAERRKPAEALRAMLDDPGVDSVLVIQDAHERLALWPEHTYLDHVRTVADISRTATKPIVLASSASAGIHPMLQELVSDSPVPFVRGLRAGVTALRSLGRWQQDAAPARALTQPAGPAGPAGRAGRGRAGHWDIT